MDSKGKMLLGRIPDEIIARTSLRCGDDSTGAYDEMFRRFIQNYKISDYESLMKCIEEMLPKEYKIEELPEGYEPEQTADITDIDILCGELYRMNFQKRSGGLPPVF